MNSCPFAIADGDASPFAAGTGSNSCIIDGSPTNLRDFVFVSDVVVLHFGLDASISNTLGLTLARGVQLSHTESRHKPGHFGLKGFCRTGRTLQRRRSFIFKPCLIGQGFHTVSVLCIGLFLKSARGQFTNIVQDLNAADLCSGKNGLPGFRVNIGPTGLLIDHFAGGGINNAAAPTLRDIDSLFPTGQQSRGTAPLFSLFIGIPLVTFTKLGDTVIFFRLPVIQLVLGRIDDHHAVFDSSGNLALRSPLKGHVRDKVGNLTHLPLCSSTFGKQPNASLTLSGILCFRVEALQIFQGWG